MKLQSSKSIWAVLIPTLLVTVSSLASAADDSFKAPRTVDEQPDLQGVWANNAITPVERPEVFGNREFLTDEEMEFLKGKITEINASGGDALFGESVLDAAFSGNVSSRDTQTGNYDQQWMVDRTLQNRTSQIIDPPNGRYPPRTEAAIAHARERNEYRQDHPADSWLDRSLSERCVHRGVPNLRPGYNSYWQIVQTRDHVSIIQEMFHDVRIIPLTNMPKLDEEIRLWNGSSRGYWDGDTLVIETQNISEGSDPGLNTAARVYQERITRVGANELQYDFIVHDPGTYTADYTRRIIFEHSDDAIYEYACHEGNYGMMNILSGHRAEEARAQQAVRE
jgi:hypothetical protein|tara:strand:+ start:479 stop:1489 length:1011 start_codon:yes stop_codon:yes gene_type:complete